MDSKKAFENSVTILFLGLTFCALAATSYDVESNRTLLLSSDCVTPAVEQVQVEIELGQMVYPAGESLTDYGFPVDDITGDIDDEDFAIEGPVGSVNRRCEKHYGEGIAGGFGGAAVYSCFDDEEYSCSIVLDEI